MPALDTNVLVGYVVQDDTAQLGAAKRLIRRLVTRGSSIFIPVTVALELEWVLRTSFGYAKEDVLQVLSSLLSAAELSFQSEQAVEVACSCSATDPPTSRTVCTSPWPRRPASNRCGLSTGALRGSVARG